ncbi:MAG: carboxypeptidase-like regulatory domain-containing protein, partial [Bacteroidota bacterium]
MIRVLSTFFSLLLAVGLAAQTGTLRGNIYDETTGDPIIYGNILLEGTTLGSTTDVDGFFNIANVPVGDYRLLATYLGYDTVAVQIKIAENRINYQRLMMQESAINLGTVNVSASRERARSEVQISTVTISQAQLKSLPSTGGEADLAQYLSVLPGVIFTGDQGGQLYIRGGSPIQNKVLLDGMTIYNPFHSIGFFSVFETESIKSVDVLTGGFNAEYGNRISAIVDIKTREGNKKRLGGVIATSPFQSKVLLEGPIKKLKPEGGGSISFLLTGKHSYIDQTSKTLYSYVNDTIGLPYNYTDLYGKVSFVGGNGSKLNLFGMNFQDNVNFAGIADLGWTSNGFGANFTLIPPSTDMVIGGTVAYSDYNVTLLE